jgi:hypothetical protein
MRHRRRSVVGVLIVVLGLSALVYTGCDRNNQSEQTEGGSVQAEAVGPPLALAEIPEEGLRIDPPVHPSQIPAGAWYCPMSRVHYASHGPGECPICHMELVLMAPEEGTGGGS